MSAPDNKPVETTRATDSAGSYVIYKYADGHIETDPPGRPLSKEDLQRERRIAVSKIRAKAILAAEGSKTGINGVTLPPSVLRENANIVTGSVLIRPYLEQIRKLSDMAETSTAAPGHINALLISVSLGGKVVGNNAGRNPEYTQDALPGPVENPYRPVATHPREV